MSSDDDVLPVVGTDAIAILENDHKVVKQLLDELTQTSGNERTAVLERLKAVLTIHTATEENLVYPAIQELAKRPIHAGQLYHQQDEAKVVVWELGMMDQGDPGFQSKATKLREAVLAHAQREEESEFPHLREAVDAGGLAKLTADVRRFRNSFVFEPSAG
jgi:hemerythrin superfamily protein